MNLRIEYRKWKQRQAIKKQAQPIELPKAKKRAFLFLAADYGNLGDVAITYAQKHFIKQYLPTYEIVEIPYTKVLNYMKVLKHQIKKEDIVTIIGGGNMGDTYESFERLRRLVISTFRNNPVICFPQTMDFTDTKYGRASKKESIKVYSHHKNLYVFAREEASYHKMKESFHRTPIFLVPDIVLSLPKQEYNLSREGIGLAIREDKEKGDNSEKIEQIVKQIKIQEENIEKLDTHIGNEKFVYSKSESYLKNFWKQFASKEIVITDRLHGMIFCYLTNTPCIVFDNINHKISQTYQLYLKDERFITLITEQTKEQIQEEIDNLRKMKVVEKINLKEKYASLEAIIRKVGK